GTARGMAARSVRTSRGAHAHARRGAGLVRRERRRDPPGLSEREARRRAGGVVRARDRQLATRGMAGAGGLDLVARRRGRALLHGRPAPRQRGAADTMTGEATFWP